jgi:hypothetical protein
MEKEITGVLSGLVQYGYCVTVSPPHIQCGSRRVVGLHMVSPLLPKLVPTHVYDH